MNGVVVKAQNTDCMTFVVNLDSLWRGRQKEKEKLNKKKKRTPFGMSFCVSGRWGLFTKRQTTKNYIFDINQGTQIHSLPVRTHVIFLEITWLSHVNWRSSCVCECHFKRLSYRSLYKIQPVAEGTDKNILWRAQRTPPTM